LFLRDRPLSVGHIVVEQGDLISSFVRTGHLGGVRLAHIGQTIVVPDEIAVGRSLVGFLSGLQGDKRILGSVGVAAIT